MNTRTMYRGNGRQQRRGRPLTLRGAERLLESWDDLYDTYVDPRDAFWDDDSGELWQSLNISSAGKERDQLVNTEAQLKQLRDECRSLARNNSFAICGHENRISYLVGSGHGYAVAEKVRGELSDEDKAAVQDVINDWLAVNRWHERQQEIVRRMDRDGECFLRFFVAADGGLRVRFVEPGQVSTPPNMASIAADTFGIRTEPDDVEAVLGYWIDGQLVDAADIQHRKANVDANVKRGLPLFFPVRKNLKRAEKLLRNMSVVAEIQAAIALIRKHAAGTRAGLDSYVSGKADQTITNTATGNTTNYRRYAPGTILDAPATTEYDFPAQGIDASRYVMVLQAELRSIAARLCMPEFMLTSDASNANFSSTMVAEGPAVKMFERCQWGLIEADLEVFDRVLDQSVVAGKLSAELREKIKIDVTPPRLVTRDRNQEVAADIQLVTARVMSVHTCQVKNDLDPEVENEFIEQEAESSMARNPFAGVGFGGEAGGEPGKKEQGDGEGDGQGDDEEPNQPPGATAK